MSAPHRDLPGICTRLGLVACVAFLGGCDNMQHQRGARDVEGSQATNAVAPEHTVARNSPVADDPAITGFRGGHPLARLPGPVSLALLERGQDRYNIYCAVCHGEDGYGSGIVVRRGFPAPPSLHVVRIRAAPDGHLFDVMTRGIGRMLPLGDRLDPADRWAVVAYMRALQRSQQTVLRSLPPSDQAKFSSRP